jgi:hypothetical protein
MSRKPASFEIVIANEEGRWTVVSEEVVFFFPTK